MKKDLDEEKIAIQRRWKKREKQIERGLGGLIGMCGAIEGIAGIQPPASLELPAGDEEYDNDD